MDWLTRMNSAIKYIEDNIMEQIDMDIITKITCCSNYHFQRMFIFITDISLSEYIRRRRLTLAAFEIQKFKSLKVIDLAVKYGYDSADSFSRAFQKVHGITPSLARDNGVKLKAYPKITFQISIKGDVEMNYKIKESIAQKVYGKSVYVKYHEVNQYLEISRFVDNCIKDGTVQSMLDESNLGKFDDIAKVIVSEKSEKPLAGLFVFYDVDNEGFRFMVACEYPEHEVSDKFEVVEIPKATWAVFEMFGKTNTHGDLDTINNIWKRLGEWFQVSGYEHAPNIPEHEKRYRMPDGYLAEVWIPIVKV